MSDSKIAVISKKNIQDNNLNDEFLRYLSMEEFDSLDHFKQVVSEYTRYYEPIDPKHLEITFYNFPDFMAALNNNKINSRTHCFCGFYLI